MVVKETAPSPLGGCDTGKGHICSLANGCHFCCLLLLSYVAAKSEAQVIMITKAVLWLSEEGMQREPGPHWECKRKPVSHSTLAGTLGSTQIDN